MKRGWSNVIVVVVVEVVVVVVVVFKHYGLRERSQMTSTKKGGGQPKLTRGDFEERKTGKLSEQIHLKSKLVILLR